MREIKIGYERVAMPQTVQSYISVDITLETMRERRERVLQKMSEQSLDVLVIYGDREHGANFAYLTGFEPRFEEAFLLLFRDGGSSLMLGNENLKMSEHSFIKGKTVPVPCFSLPCQPMHTDKTLSELFAEAGIVDGMSVGCAGWKLFTGKRKDEEEWFDLPSFMMEALRKQNPRGKIYNACGIFLDPAEGLRNRKNANEVAHYEAGAGLASARVLQAVNALEPGKTEREVADLLSSEGQPLTVTTICASGERFADAVVFPRNRKIRLGDPYSVTLGLRGGLSSRAGYVAGAKEDLPEGATDYLERVAIPYYRAAVLWYETVGVGVSCGMLYEKIEEILPKSRYGWILNPGHYTDDQEWSSSPFYKDSPVILQSGMLLQMDVIPSVPGYGGASAEDGVALADENLREEIRKKYPSVWERMLKRRTYMRKTLGIEIGEDVLPMSDICGYFRPLVLNREYALKRL